jgi:hypothetical protein
VATLVLKNRCEQVAMDKVWIREPKKGEFADL